MSRTIYLVAIAVLLIAAFAGSYYVLSIGETWGQAADRLSRFLPALLLFFFLYRRSAKKN